MDVRWSVFTIKVGRAPDRGGKVRSQPNRLSSFAAFTHVARIAEREKRFIMSEPYLPEAAATISAIKTAVDTGKAVSNALKAVKNRDLKDQVFTLLDQIRDVQTSVLDLADKNQELHREVVGLKEKLRQQDEYFFDKIQNSYWRRMADGQLDGPYCPKCYNDPKSPRVVPMALRGQEVKRSYHRCPQCGFQDKYPPSGGRIAVVMPK
jgi:hypothetical protein